MYATTRKTQHDVPHPDYLIETPSAPASSRHSPCRSARPSATPGKRCHASDPQSCQGEARQVAPEADGPSAARRSTKQEPLPSPSPPSTQPIPFPLVVVVVKERKNSNFIQQAVNRSAHHRRRTRSPMLDMSAAQSSQVSVPTRLIADRVRRHLSEELTSGTLAFVLRFPPILQEPRPRPLVLRPVRRRPRSRHLRRQHHIRRLRAPATRPSTADAPRTTSASSSTVSSPRCRAAVAADPSATTASCF